MSESHEPYLTERKKVLSVKAAIPPSLVTVDFEQEFKAWLESKGYTYEGLTEVSYEEEKT